MQGPAAVPAQRRRGRPRAGDRRPRARRLRAERPRRHARGDDGRQHALQPRRSSGRRASPLGQVIAINAPLARPSTRVAAAAAVIPLAVAAPTADRGRPIAAAAYDAVVITRHWAIVAAVRVRARIAVRARLHPWPGTRLLAADWADDVAEPQPGQGQPKAEGWRRALGLKDAPVLCHAAMNPCTLSSSSSASSTATRRDATCAAREGAKAVGSPSATPARPRCRPLFSPPPAARARVPSTIPFVPSRPPALAALVALPCVLTSARPPFPFRVPSASVRPGRPLTLSGFPLLLPFLQQRRVSVNESGHQADVVPPGAAAGRASQYPLLGSSRRGDSLVRSEWVGSSDKPPCTKALPLCHDPLYLDSPARLLLRTHACPLQAGLPRAHLVPSRRCVGRTPVVPELG